MSPESSPEVNPAPVKPGYQTTEFWGKLVVQLIGLLVVFGIIQTDEQGHAQEVALGFIAALEALYQVIRGIVKRSAGVSAWLLAGLLSLAFSTSALAQGTYQSPSILSYTPVGEVFQPLAAVVTGNPAPDIFYIDAFTRTIAGSGPVFFPTTPGLFVLVAQNRDTVTPDDDIASVGTGCFIWDTAQSVFRLFLPGWRPTNAPEGQPQYVNNGRKMGSQMVAILVR